MEAYRHPTEGRRESSLFEKKKSQRIPSLHNQRIPRDGPKPNQHKKKKICLHNQIPSSDLVNIEKREE